MKFCQSHVNKLVFANAETLVRQTIGKFVWKIFSDGGLCSSDLRIKICGSSNNLTLLKIVNRVNIPLHCLPQYQNFSIFPIFPLKISARRMETFIFGQHGKYSFFNFFLCSNIFLQCLDVPFFLLSLVVPLSGVCEQTVETILLKK